VIKNFPEKAHQIEVLQSVVSCLGMFYKKENVLNEDYQYPSIVKLLAKIHLIIANWNRIRNGDNPLEPNPDFDYVENFLYMYFRAPLCIDKYSMHGKIFVYTHLT
jgi:citrate synthase